MCRCSFLRLCLCQVALSGCHFGSFEVKAVGYNVRCHLLLQNCFNKIYCTHFFNTTIF